MTELDEKGPPKPEPKWPTQTMLDAAGMAWFGAPVNVSPGSALAKIVKAVEAVNPIVKAAIALRDNDHVSLTEDDLKGLLINAVNEAGL